VCASGRSDALHLVCKQKVRSVVPSYVGASNKGDKLFAYARFVKQQHSFRTHFNILKLLPVSPEASTRWQTAERVYHSEEQGRMSGDSIFSRTRELSRRRSWSTRRRGEYPHGPLALPCHYCHALRQREAPISPESIH